MKLRWILVLILLGILGSVALWEDPFYHKEKVNFWTWVYREGLEQVRGEPTP